MPSISQLGYSQFNRKDNADINEEIVELQQVIPPSGVEFQNLNINVFEANQNIQSENFVSGSAGWRIQGNGLVEFAAGIFRGSLVAGNIHIPDENTTASSFHVNSSGDAWWGCINTQFTADRENAIAYVTADGTVKFTSGKVGGWTLGEDYIKDTAGGVGMSSAVTAGDDIRFWAGDVDPTIAPFRVTEFGNLVATSANISGSITATTGTIGGWIIGATTLSDDAVTDNSKILIDSGNTLIRVGTSSSYINVDGANLKIESSNYSSGTFGSGFHLSPDLLEVGNIACRGIFRTAVFQKDVISAVGGSMAILDADVLETTMTALDACHLITKDTSTFVVGDFLRIKDRDYDEWFEVTTDNGSGDYTVNRDKASNYGADSNPLWSKGTAVVNYGASGEGGLNMTASETNAPYMSVFTHAGSPWSALTTRVRIGNLNGYLGESSDVYGMAIGESDNYLKYDPTNGLRIKGEHAELDVGSTGYILGGQTGYATGTGFFLGYDVDAYKFSLGSTNNYIKWDGTYLKLLGSFDVGSNGVINNSPYTVANLPIAPTEVGFNDPSGTE